jgi:hypothetical protein
VTLDLSAALGVAERQTLNLPVTFVANNDALASGSLILDVLGDDRPGAAIGQVTLNYSLSEAKPYLSVSPGFVETGLAQGGSAVESVQLRNQGLQDALKLHFTLTRPDGSAPPAWAALASAADGTLAVGEQRSVDIRFTPPASTAEGVYELRLDVVGDNLVRQSLSVFASVTQSGQGSVLFKAADIYTATLDKSGHLIKGLAGASITLQNEDVLTVTQEIVTDAVGEALFQNLPAGRYPVYYGELSLANYGLIRADNVRQKLPQSDAFFRYEFFIDIDAPRRTRDTSWPGCLWQERPLP